MIGFDQLYDYEELVSRNLQLLRRNLPQSVINNCVEHDNSQLKAWGSKRRAVAVYFIVENGIVKGGEYNDPDTGVTHFSPTGPWTHYGEFIAFITAFYLDLPQKEQIEQAWTDFRKLCPRYARSMDRGSCIVTMQIK